MIHHSLRSLSIAVLFCAALTRSGASQDAKSDDPQPFGSEFPNLDSMAVGQWWNKPIPDGPNPPPDMKVDRNQVVVFAIYTVDHGVLKLTAQLYPLMPGEVREARLEFQRDGKWTEAAKSAVLYPGWSAHFRVENWDGAVDVPYRVRHGEKAQFEGLIFSMGLVTRYL